VTPLRLRTVEQAEAGLRALGITGNLRVRHFGETARVELDPGSIAYWSEGGARLRLDATVRAAGFAHVELDPRGFRSGALNILAGITAGGT
jgi:uncharacterized protein